MRGPTPGGHISPSLEFLGKEITSLPCLTDAGNAAHQPCARPHQCPSAAAESGVVHSPSAPVPLPKGKRVVLDLFSGTGSVGDYFRQRGFHVISLDCEKRFNPDICVDILHWDYMNSGFPRGRFFVVCAGVPCTEYSIAKTTAPRDLESADLLVAKTLEIIRWFSPPFWWIENPRMGLLKDRDVMKGIPFVDVDYCQFSDWGYQKPTRIWCCPPCRN